MDGGRVGVSTGMGSPLVWGLHWYGVSTGMGSGGGRARPAVGVTFGLFTSMSALVVVEGGIVSFLEVWRC